MDIIYRNSRVLLTSVQVFSEHMLVEGAEKRKSLLGTLLIAPWLGFALLILMVRKGIKDSSMHRFSLWKGIGLDL